MKRSFLTIVAIFMMGMTWAQTEPTKIGAGILKTAEGISNMEKNIEQAALTTASEAIRNTKPTTAPSPLTRTDNRTIVPMPKEMKAPSIQQYVNTTESNDFVAVPAYKPPFDDGKNMMLGLTKLFYHRIETEFSYSNGKQNRETALLMLERFLSYVKIESQAVEVEDPDSFPLTEGQKQIAQFIHEELKEICKGKKIEIKMSPDYYIYVKVPSNIKKKSPSVMFMAHMDIAPARDGKGVGINPQIHPNYDGKDITLGNGLVLSPNNPEGYHLKDLKGKTIITTDGTTLLGADCKTGCAILVTLIEQMVNDKKFKHGDVYFCFGQNEEIGKIQDRFDLNYFDKIPDILFDVDGGDYGEFSKSNFTAEMRSYYFKGNQVHPSHAKEYKFADANTAMAYFIGQITPEMHPTNSEGLQGYIQCYMIDTQLPDANNPHDARIGFRIRYFDKADGELYHSELDKAYNKTKEAFPFVEITMESNSRFYDNIAYTMHPKSIEVIEKAAEITDGIQMVGTDLRAGTTSALMVAKGLPGGPCIYSGQQAEHSVYEWCCLEEMMDIVRLTRNIVTEVSELKQ